METIYLTGGDLVLPAQVKEKTTLLIEGERITAIGGPRPNSAQVISAEDCFILPGLIDLHYHGRLISLDPEKLPELLAQDCRDLLASGVTRFLPTLASARVADWRATFPALSRALAQAQENAEGAIPIGIHLEGIFLSRGAAGAHPPDLLLPFQADNPEHRAIFTEGKNLIRMMTFAPEVGGNEKLLEICQAHGILPSLGHSTASPDQARIFADQGLLHMTHLFNGMKGIHHRDPGPPLLGLLDPRISVDFICDGYHLHPEIVQLIHRLKPPEKRVLITDAVLINLPGAISGTGEEPNFLPNGGLAGSRLKLIRAVKNYMRFTGCPLPEAVAMASLNPARLLGLEQDLGSLEPGKLADLVIVNRELVPRMIFIAGKIKSG